jgi:putative membrane protein insertion efficiency factor
MIQRMLTWPLIMLVRCYQRVISPLLPPSCRFYPSCSQYAVDALAGHGLVRGLGLTLWRLLRCGPWHPGGIDPVPPLRTRPRAERAGPDASHDEARSDPDSAPPTEERTAC